MAALLVDTYIDFEYIDTGFSMTTDAEIEFVNAYIYAPIGTCRQLRELPENEVNVILQALQEVYPVSESGGMYIQKISFNINPVSLRENITEMATVPIGWLKVDRTTDRIRTLIVVASTQEHYQEVGLLCRECLISLSQAVFDPSSHPPLPGDDSDVSPSDVKRMIARYVESEYKGSSGKEIRRCVNSTLDLANKVTHDRSSEYRDVLLCVQATLNVVGLLAVISGKVDFATNDNGETYTIDSE